MSKYFQHQTPLLESSAIPPLLHLQTELGSKAQTKWEMMLDEIEPMEFFEILHFENLLKSYVHLGSQCDILGMKDIPGMKALLAQKLFGTLRSFSKSEIQKPP